MTSPEPVGSICQPPDSGIWDNDRLEFIWCVGRRQLKIHEVWTLGNDGSTLKIHPTARVDVGAFIGDCFATDYLTENGRRVPMLGRKYINGSFEWMGVPDFLRTDGPPWTAKGVHQSLES